MNVLMGMLLSAVLAAPVASEPLAISQSIVVMWQDNSDNENGFHIFRRLGTSTTYAWIAATQKNIASYVDKNVTEGKRYCYLIFSFNQVGRSDSSNEACTTA